MAMHVDNRIWGRNGEAPPMPLNTAEPIHDGQSSDGMGRMTKRESEHADPARLRKETREWLATRTIPNVREVARDLENAGEDVHDLMAAIDELESLVRGARTKPRKRAVAKSHA